MKLPPTVWQWRLFHYWRCRMTLTITAGSQIGYFFTFSQKVFIRETCCNDSKLHRSCSEQFWCVINLPWRATLLQCLVKMHPVSNNQNRKPAKCSPVCEQFGHNESSLLYIYCQRITLFILHTMMPLSGCQMVKKNTWLYFLICISYTCRVGLRYICTFTWLLPRY